MVDAVEVLKAERDTLERRLKAVNTSISLLGGSSKSAGGKKRHISAAGRKALSAAAKKMWRDRKAKAAKA